VVSNRPKGNSLTGIINDLWIGTFAQGKKKMSPDKTNALIEAYPQLFSGLHGQSCFALFGFECDDGWFELLKDCIQEIKELCERKGLNIRASQVKEKYGTLRFYLNTTTDELERAIDKAEEKSAVTCELCGKEGKVCAVYTRWYKAVCEACRKEKYS
jgi:hypothetical protein